MEQKVIKVIPLNLSLLETLGQGKVYEALVLQQVDYWCTINKNKNEYYIEGSYWTFSSVKKMLERDFPLCFSYDTLKRILNNLEEGNFLITKKHKNGKLYRVNYNKISFNKNLKSDKNITKNENKNQNPRLVQNAPTEKVKLGQNAPTQKSEVRANCTNGEGKMHQPVRAKCTNQLGQNAPTIKEINKENNIYINYNNFIKNKELSNNKGLTDKDNLYNQTTNDLIFSEQLKQDVELAISQANLKTIGDYNINGVSVGVTVVQDVLKDVTETQINYCVEQILKSKQINNFENYVIASLYNSITRDKQNKINNQNSTLGKFNWWDE